MFELIALTIGVALGVAARRLGPRAGVPLVVVGAFATGFLVSSLSGELESSLGFLVFDVGQTIVAAVCAVVLLGALARRHRTA